MTSDILKRAAEAQTESKAYFEANGIVVTDPGLVPELIVEIARLTARAEAAEAREAALLAANDVNRKLMLERNAEVDRWKKMADRLAEALKKTSDAHMSLAHDSYDGCWTIEDFDSKSAVATEALAAHAAMKEGR